MKSALQSHSTSKANGVFGPDKVPLVTSSLSTRCKSYITIINKQLEHHLNMCIFKHYLLKLHLKISLKTTYTS